MKKIKYKLKENNGNAVYIIGVVFLFAMIAFTYGIMFVTSQYAVITDIKKSSQITLDSYVNEKSVDIYSSIKNSHDYTRAISADVYKGNLRKTLGLNSGMECFNGNKLKYRLSNIRLETIEGNELKIRATVRIYIPFYFLGEPVSAINADLPVESRFNFK